MASLKEILPNIPKVIYKRLEIVKNKCKRTSVINSINGKFFKYFIGHPSEQITILYASIAIYSGQRV